MKTKRMVMGVGFSPSIIDDEDVLRVSKLLGSAPLSPDGQWDSSIPVPEEQNKGFEPYACVSFSTLNAIETITKKKYNISLNLSDRWLAYSTGTWEKKGNDPEFVCNFLKKNGDVLEIDWGYDVNNYYATPPDYLSQIAKEFVIEYDFDHDWVPATPEKMMDALTRSPLAVAVDAWVQDSKGNYVFPEGGRYNHYTMVYGYEKGVAWHILDDYAPFLKKLPWDYPFIQIKEFSVERKVVRQNFFIKFIQLFRALFGLPLVSEEPFTPQPVDNTPIPPATPTVEPVTTPTPKRDMVTECANAQKAFEGWYPGSASYKRNNPGNLTNADGTFKTFATSEKGFDALKAYIVRVAQGNNSNYPKKGDTTIMEYTHIYTGDKEPVPTNYGNFIANKLNIAATFKMKDLLS